MTREENLAAAQAQLRHKIPETTMNTTRRPSRIANTRSIEWAESKARQPHYYRPPWEEVTRHDWLGSCRGATRRALLHALIHSVIDYSILTERGSILPGNAQEPNDAEQDDEEFDPDRAIQLATDIEGFMLIADIVGHPQGSISFEELSYMNPRLNESALSSHLQKLECNGIVATRTLDQDERVEGYPFEFYVLTDQAKTLFDQLGLFPEAGWERVYAWVEKSARIRCLEAFPRPGRKKREE